MTHDINQELLGRLETAADFLRSTGHPAMANAVGQVIDLIKRRPA